MAPLSTLALPLNFQLFSHFYFVFGCLSYQIMVKYFVIAVVQSLSNPWKQSSFLVNPCPFNVLLYDRINGLLVLHNLQNWFLPTYF
jgi:hypothetical protein